MHIPEHTKQKHACACIEAKMCVHAAKLVLHKTLQKLYWKSTTMFMTLSLKVSKPPLQRYLQNNAEHACNRHKCKCKVSTHVHALFCFVCARFCTDLYQNLFGCPLLCYELKFQISKRSDHQLWRFLQNTILRFFADCVVLMLS